jgi:hypothetical protein
MSVGILAFGSIADKPGTELAAATTRRIEVETPFAVEFARSSRTRAGAPTLVPVSEGGAHASATRRRFDINNQSRVAWIAELPNFAGTSTCLYTALRANIRPLNAEKLAELAVLSATAPAGAKHRDGISYLQEQKNRGLVTPLMPAYEEAVLAVTDARDLDDAWRRVRSGAACQLNK